MRNFPLSGNSANSGVKNVTRVTADCKTSSGENKQTDICILHVKKDKGLLWQKTNICDMRAEYQHAGGTPALENRLSLNEGVQLWQVD
jgi:hypothetical protein